MSPPAGTFLGKVRDGVMQLPPPLRQYCQAEGWSLFHFVVNDTDRLTMHPVPPERSGDSFQASLDGDGRLWIPEHMRKTLALGEQSVLLRIENGAISVYLRKIFETLGFRPG